MAEIFNTLVGRSFPKQEIGPYKLREELARGGSGVVYKALDPRLG